MAMLRRTRRCLAAVPLLTGLGAATEASWPVVDLSLRRHDFDFHAAATAAVEAMMSTYVNHTGLYGEPESPWYQSGIALQATLDYMLATGSTEYLPQALNTIERQRVPVPWWPEGGGEFRADSTDDTGWWALAMTSMYELTGDGEYLDIARLDEEYMFRYWNTTTCGGGLIWDIRDLAYQNAISNELYLTLTARLHRLIHGDTRYLNQSLFEWEWFAASGMINSENLVNDGLTQDAACVNNGQTTWTYNQGVLLGGLVDLFEATGNHSFIERARAVADAVLNSDLLVRDGILTEDCPPGPDCELDAPIFKGIFIRYLAKLDRALPGERPYREFIEANARSAYDSSRNGSDFYGYLWQGPFDTFSIARQVSAVNLMVAGL
ncbi:hypothetical protein DL765_003975 [Monosporascus sp. GIB2]|nr:hypothetical protein DL765_003975 [Monosporascus sp. GIB2]